MFQKQNSVSSLFTSFHGPGIHQKIFNLISHASGKRMLLISLYLPVLLFGCDITGGNDETMEFEYDFRESDHDWEAFFTDYNVGWGDDMELESDYRPLPEPLDTEDYGHYISAVNHSDDVKMLFRHQIDGLEPNTRYNAGFTVRFASSAPSGCAGIGGAPGEAVRVIAAASSIRPEPVVGHEDEDYYLLNIQHQDDSMTWYQNAIMGDIANGRDCEEDRQFVIKEVSSGPNHDQVQTDEKGRAWLLFGTRSGFEGQTDLYYTYFKAEMSR